ncbi:uncharacterized protein Pyn_26821 [Prunus yedoensis var. nudiflora]|uniref:Protein MEF2BNB homolog n=1 Tax=Prunus yedoensis var. nudiflora TaxID=2094558 RepID=A0A314YCH2_PRUYE|nr:uncharacterized protein Pyn_26821 [Prunus yedoensis var. nudiflora]
MHGFSTVDGFVEITEGLAEMIKYVANEPSVGLFYIQQHTQNAVPNLVSLRNTVVDKSRETTLHTEDSEDSIAMVRSMKECGFPIADEMIRDIKKSLAVMSTKQPKRGLIHNQTSSFQMGRTSSWKPASWVRSPSVAQQDTESGYFSTVIKSARQKASNFKWPPLDSKELTQASYPNPTPSVASASTSSSLPDVEAEELPVSSHVADEQQEDQVDDSLSTHNLVPMEENFDEFKADKELKLQEWLEGTGNVDNRRGASAAERF